MEKLWFKTKNYRIIDLMKCDSFSLEKWLPTQQFCVYAINLEESRVIGIFDKEEDAQEYLHEIYQALKFPEEK